MSIPVRIEIPGVSMQEATEVVRILAKVAAKVPFPEGRELRSVLLRAWRRDYGALRFCCPRWWGVFLWQGEPPADQEQPLPPPPPPKKSKGSTE